jgi:hypothetical protein
MALAPQAEILARLTLMADCNPLVKPAAAAMCDDGASTTSGGTDMEPSSLPPSPNELFSLPEDSTSASEDAEHSKVPEELEIPKITLDQNGFPSVGSIGHFSGQCTRCCFHPKGRCLNGYDCNFCHFEHDKRKRTTKLELFQKRVFHKPSYAGLSFQQIQHPVSPPVQLQAPPGLAPLCTPAVPQQHPSNVAPPMPCAPPMGHASWTSEMVANWLSTNGLGHLVTVFMAHRITGDVLLDLTSDDLVEIGVQALGDRKRFLRAAAQFRSPSGCTALAPPRIDVYPGQLVVC